MTYRHAAHAAIRNPADGLLHIAVTPEGGAARNNRPVSGLASLDASPSRKVRAHRPRAMPRCPSSGWRFLRNRRDASALTYRCGGSRGIAAVCRAPRSRFTQASAEARAPVANIRLNFQALPGRTRAAQSDFNRAVLSQRAPLPARANAAAMPCGRPGSNWSWASVLSATKPHTACAAAANVVPTACSIGRKPSMMCIFTPSAAMDRPFEGIDCRTEDEPLERVNESTEASTGQRQIN